jgi:uncharacterized protein YbaR (Trm112 family)
MAIAPENLAVLVCPVCKAKVGLTSDAAGLECPVCRWVYPVRDEIPVMLVNEAKTGENGAR